MAAYLARVWRIAHSDPSTAESIVRYRPLQSLVAWIPEVAASLWRSFTAGFLRWALLFGLAWILIEVLRSDGRAARKISLVHRLALIACFSLFELQSLPFLQFSWRDFWPVLLLFSCAALRARTDRREVLQQLLGLFACGATALFVSFAIWQPDDPWMQYERLFVRSLDTSKFSPTSYCEGWVLGEEANGRWLIVMLAPSRSVVAVETSAIGYRQMLSKSDETRQERLLGKQPAAEIPTTTTPSTPKVESEKDIEIRELAATVDRNTRIENACPSDIIDREKLANSGSGSTVPSTTPP
jgi:hypothetical protein